jgi:hypothetical protein
LKTFVGEVKLVDIGSAESACLAQPSLQGITRANDSFQLDQVNISHSIGLHTRYSRRSDQQCGGNRGKPSIPRSMLPPCRWEIMYRYCSFSGPDVQYSPTEVATKVVRSRCRVQWYPCQPRSVPGTLPPLLKSYTSRSSGMPGARFFGGCGEGFGLGGMWTTIGLFGPLLHNVR